ncbi:MAG: DUF4390 domain-containing protein [Cocleimonas sp.]
MAIPSATIAEGINFKNFKLLGSSPSYQVLTGVEFGLTNYLQNALNNGISLNTRIQFRVQQNRDWWFDKEKTLLTIHYQLKYHALSQHYLLTRNDTNEHWNFSNLSSALRKLGELRKYSLPPIKTPLDSDNYSLFVIAEMSPATLRLPLRIQSLFSDKYRLASEGVLWPLP